VIDPCINSTLIANARELTAHLTIRPGRRSAEDAAAFADLYNEANARKVKPAYYLWQFFSAPNPGRCLFVEDDGTPVAVYGTRVMDFDGPEERIGLAVDLIVSPSARRLGLWAVLETQIEQAARDEGCTAIYASPDDATLAARVKDLAWVALPERIFHESATLSGEGPEAVAAEAGLAFARVPSFSQEADDVRDAFRRLYPGRIMTRRDRRYLNWRYAANAWYSYDILWFERSGEPFGYVIVKPFREPQSRQLLGDVVDIAWAANDAQKLRAMLRAALSHLGALGCARASTWLQTGTMLDHAAADIGFVATPRTRHLCYKPLNPQHQRLKDRAAWLLTMGDVELF